MRLQGDGPIDVSRTAGATGAVASTASTGRSAADWNEMGRQSMLAQEVTIRCADCPWEHTAAVSTARLEWAKHRRDEHDDDVIAQVQAELNGEAAMKLSGQNLEENLRKTRLAGGGHGQLPGAAAPDPFGVDALIRDAIRWQTERGHLPTSSEWQRDNGPTWPKYATVRKHFSGWGEFLAAVELELERTGLAEEGQADAGPPERPVTEEVDPDPDVEAGHVGEASQPSAAEPADTGPAPSPGDGLRPQPESAVETSLVDDLLAVDPPTLIELVHDLEEKRVALAAAVRAIDEAEARAERIREDIEISKAAILEAVTAEQPPPLPEPAP